MQVNSLSRLSNWHSVALVETHGRLATGVVATPSEDGPRADYTTIVMRRRPPTATKPMPISGACALVVAIAMPPTKANTPTTAAVDRLT